MITVITPTMWKAQEINVMLPKLNEHELIGEIIIIDNDPSHKNENTCSLSKVTYLTFGENIYCNPAWNRGYEVAKYDKLMFINDDASFTITLIDAIHDVITEDNGMIVASPESVLESISGNYVLRETPSKNISFKPIPQPRHKCAITFGIHKKNYTIIPEQLKIHRGDTFLFGMCMKNKKQNLATHNAEFRTKMSTTIRSDRRFREVTRKDAELGAQIWQEYELRGIVN